MQSQTIFKIVFYTTLALPWVALVVLAIADEVVFRRTYGRRDQ